MDADDYIVKNAPESLADLMKKFLAATKDLSSIEDRLLEEAMRGVIKLRRMVLDDSLNQLRFFQEEAQQNGNAGSSYQETVMKHTLMLRKLDEAQQNLRLRRLG